MKKVNLLEYKNKFHIEFIKDTAKSIIHLPPLQDGTIEWLRFFANIYYAYPNQTIIDNLSKGRLLVPQLNRLFKEPYDEKLLGHKAYLCDIALQENWDTPVLVSKIQNRCTLMTGNGKVIAQKIAKKLPENFKCILFDYDKTNLNDWNILKDLRTDQDLSEVLNYTSWHLEMEFVYFKKTFYPKVTYFAFDSNNVDNFDDAYISVGQKTINFLKTHTIDDKMTIYIHDKHNSNIIDTSGLFDIKKSHCDLGDFLSPNEVRHKSKFRLYGIYSINIITN